MIKYRDKYYETSQYWTKTFIIWDKESNWYQPYYSHAFHFWDLFWVTTHLQLLYSIYNYDIVNFLWKNNILKKLDNHKVQI